MAKSTITFSVNADTKQAKAQLQGLKSQIDQAGKSAGGKSPLGGISDAFGKISKFAAPAAAGAAAVGAALKATYDGMKAFSEAGKDAQQQYDKLSTVFGTLQKNLTGNGNAGGLVDFIQHLSAGGASSVDDLATAGQRLMVAFGGDQSKVKELLPMLDDLAVGTGKSVTEWATLNAKVAETGVNTKTLNQLANSGIPIYKALSATMGVSESEVKKLAEAGRISTEDWNNAVKELHQNYKGLSAEISNNTLQGLKDTAAANKGLANRRAAEAYDNERKEFYAEQGEKWASRENSVNYQAVSSEVSEMVGALDNFKDSVLETVEPLNLMSNALIALNKVGLSGAIERQRKEMETDAELTRLGISGTLAPGAKDINGNDYTAAQRGTQLEQLKDAKKAYVMANSNGNTNLQQVEEYLKSTGDAGIKEYLQLIEQLEKEAAKLREEEAAKAAEETAERLRKDYEREHADTAEQKARAMGYDGYQDLFEAFARARNNITSGKGTEEDAQLMKQLQPVIDTYRKEVDAAAKAAEQQRREDERAAEERRREEERAAAERLRKEEQLEQTRLKYATTPEQMKDIVNRYMGYDASTGNVSARAGEIRAGLADGSLEPSPELMRELSVFEAYLAKIDEEAAEAAKTPEAIQSMKEAEAAEAAKQREVRTQAGLDTARQKGREWLRDNRGTAELSQLDREARSLTQLQRTRFNKSRAKNDSEYEENWKQAQELKKLGIKDVNAMREFKAGEKAEAAEKEKLQRMDTIINKLDTFAPTYQ